MTTHATEQLIHALEESNSLFAALMHEPRDYDEIEAQLAQNRDAIEAARRVQVVPHGHKLVPEDLTPEMKREFMDMLMDGIDIYVNSADQIEIQTDAPRRIWSAMLAAAPQPPEEDSLMSEIRTSKTVAAPAPKFNHAAKRKLELLQGDGASITGYAIEKGGRRGAIDCHGFVYWWNEAAPVQMPEPFAYMEHHKAGDNLWFDCPGGKYSGLYTEHQVRQILAAHGITKN